MKTVLLVLLATVLGGCANSTLVVRGNLPGTTWIAEKAVQVHSQSFCGTQPRAEKRVAKVQKQKTGTHTYVRHECAH